MKEHPILFSGEMVRAILAGRKTQTRRAVKPQPEYGGDPMVFVGWTFPKRKGGGSWIWPNARDQILADCPYGVPGDRLWVRETWAWFGCERDPHEVAFQADTDDYVVPGGFKRWRPSIHMPRWASRITLEVTGVRVERLQDISEDDAKAEGCIPYKFPGPWWQGYKDLGDGELIHQQSVGDMPPDWMIEPKRMKDSLHLDRSAVDAYRALWLAINGPGAWDENPWVWVLEFRRLC